MVVAWLPQWQLNISGPVFRNIEEWQCSMFKPLPVKYILFFYSFAKRENCLFIVASIFSLCKLFSLEFLANAKCSWSRNADVSLASLFPSSFSAAAFLFSSLCECTLWLYSVFGVWAFCFYISVRSSKSRIFEAHLHPRPRMLSNARATLFFTNIFSINFTIILSISFTYLLYVLHYIRVLCI